MKQIVYILTMILLCGKVWAFGPTGCNDSIGTSLSSAISISDTCYYLTGNQWTSGSRGVIQSGVHDIRLNLRGYTVTFAGSGSDTGEYGLSIGANCYNITIHNGNIVHGGDSTTDGSNCIEIGSGCHDIKFSNCSLYVQGGNATCVNGEVSGLYDIRFDTCDFRSDAWGFTSANASDQHPVKFTDMAPSGLGNDTLTWLEPDVNGYDFLFYGCRLWGPGGLSVGGVTVIAQCSLTVDARNDFYSYPSDAADHGMKNSCAIGGALRCDSSGRTAVICSTTIRAGTNYAGCDEGMLLQTARGYPGYEIRVFDNDVDVHCGKDHYYGYTDNTGWNCKAVKFRGGCNSIKLYDNTLKTTVGDTTLSSYGMKSATLYLISNYDGGAGLYGHLDSNHWIYNNTIIADTNGTAINRQRAVMISAGDNYPSMDHDWDSVNINWYGNSVQSNGWCYDIGDEDGDARGVKIREDTINLLSQVGSEYHNTVCIATDWGESDSCINNRLQDCYYTSGDETDVIMWANTWSELELWRTIQCTVMAGSSPANGVEVWFKNSANSDSLTATSDANGLATKTVRYYDNFTGSGSPADTLIADYYPFTIGAVINDSTVTDTLNVEWDNYQITLTGPEGGGTTKKTGAVKLGKVKL